MRNEVVVYWSVDHFRDKCQVEGSLYKSVMQIGEHLHRMWGSKKTEMTGWLNDKVRALRYGEVVLRHGCFISRYGGLTLSLVGMNPTSDKNASTLVGKEIPLVGIDQTLVGMKITVDIFISALVEMNRTKDRNVSTLIGAKIPLVEMIRTLVGMDILLREIVSPVWEINPFKIDLV